MASVNNATVEVTALSKTFPGNKKALRDVSLRISRGEMVALIGASGSGKSTLIRHIAGLVQGDREQGACQIRVHGKTVQEGGRIHSRAADIRKDIGVTFQQFNLISRMKVLKNVLAGLLGSVPRWRGTLGLFT